MEMFVNGESHPSVSDRIAKAEKVAYLYVAPVILAVGLFGSAANLLVLSNKRRFDGRLYVYLRVRKMETRLTCSIPPGTCLMTVTLKKPDFNRPMLDHHHAEFFSRNSSTNPH